MGPAVYEPILGDYNGDGRDERVIHRRSNVVWHISTWGRGIYGESGDRPVLRATTCDDVAVYRPSNDTWYSLNPGNFLFGEVSNIPLPADYSGDGRQMSRFVVLQRSYKPWTNLLRTQSYPFLRNVSKSQSPVCPTSEHY